MHKDCDGDGQKHKETYTFLTRQIVVTHLGRQSIMRLWKSIMLMWPVIKMSLTPYPYHHAGCQAGLTLEAHHTANQEQVTHLHTTHQTLYVLIHIAADLK